MTRTAGWLLLAGAGVFFTAAFAPASYVFGMRDAAERRAHLDRHAFSWRWGQLLFAAGAVVSAVGLLVLGVQLDGTTGTAIALSGALALGGAFPWAEHCRRRALAVDDFLEGRLPGWHFLVYVWCTLAALAVTGVALLHTDLPQWTAWFVLGASALLTAAMLRFRDLPPFVLYVVTVVVGAVAL
jgi:hypothetical protein